MNLTAWNLDDVCSRVDLGSEAPEIDLSGVTFIEPFALIYLGMFLRYFNARGKRFRVNLPGTDAQRYLARQNFFDRFNFDPATISDELLRRFTTATSLNDIVDIERRPGIDEEVAQRVRRVAANNGASLDLALLEEIAAELVSNFARHSQGPLAALMMQYYPKLRIIRLAVGDCGIGIRSSLSSNAAYASLATRPHYAAALKAFEPGVSRSREGRFGLYTVVENVKDMGGDLILATGNGYVRTFRSRTLRYGEMSFDLSGVQIEVSIPTG